jgi:hypothetical protein
MIAGLCVMVQGLSKMFFGAPLGAGDLRNIAVGVQFVQDAQPVVPLIFGACDDPEVFCFANPCDEFCYDPLEDPLRISGFPLCDDYFDDSMSVINQLFNFNPFGNSVLTYAQVLTGRLLGGSVNSLKVIDGATMLVRSAFRSLGAAGGTEPFPAPVYFLVGHYTDVGVIGEPGNPQSILAISIAVTVANDSPGASTVGGQLYDQVNNRWEFMGLLPGSGAMTTYIFPGALNGQSYINHQNGHVLGRGWVYVPGFGATIRFNSAFDAIEFLFLSSGIGGGSGTP